MTELELFGFIIETDTEYRFVDDFALIFIDLRQVGYFNSLLPNTIYDEGISCKMKEGYIVVDLKDKIADYCDIDLDNIKLQLDKR